jgi:signal transduction histidine kinase
MVDAVRELWILKGGTSVPTRVVITAAAILGITALHHLTPIEMLHWHNIFQHLYYLPIVVAALSFGWRGGLAAAMASGLSQTPHILQTWNVALNYSEDLIWEVPAFCAAGILTGLGAERLQRQHKVLQQTTDRLTAVYQELQNNFESMKRAERLFAIGQLSAGLAHEIRNPLAGIAGAAGILRRNPDSEPKRTECLAIIDKECERLNRLLTNFLQFARPRTPQWQRVDAGVILDSVVGLAQHALNGKPVTLRKEVAAELPALQCDPEQLKQVLLNLVINAVQATEKQGCVTLSGSVRNDKVLLEVRDEGSGIDPQNLDRIFNPFFTTKENGTGLGLSVVHQIVEQHGGLLSVRNNSGRGATFSILLPARAEGRHES